MGGGVGLRGVGLRRGVAGGWRRGNALAGALGGRPGGDGRRRKKGKSEVGEEAG